MTVQVILLDSKEMRDTIIGKDCFNCRRIPRPCIRQTLQKKGLGVEKACEILKLGAGVQWDKELVKTIYIFNMLSYKCSK